MRRNYVFALILNCSFPASGQQIINAPGIDELIIGKSGLILNDEVEINILGKERDTEDEAAASFRAFRIRRKYSIKILSPEGIRIFKNISLPEDFDPTFISHGPTVKKLGVYYSGYKIDEFRIHVKRKGKKPFYPKLNKSRTTFESFNIDYLYDYSRTTYSTTEVEVGDEVTVWYDLMIPFQENYSRFASYRIFYHDSLPKLKYRLTITHHESIDIELNTIGQKNLPVQLLENGIVSRVMTLEDLPGCINENGARPYLQLPHITWVLNFYKYYVHNSFRRQNVPHYAVISMLRSPELPEILTAIQIGSMSRNYAPFAKVLEQMNLEGLPESVVAKTIHSEILNNFRYENDLQYYRRNDPRAERLGEFLDNKILRDKSRYNMYYALLAASKVNFYSVYTVDNRFGEFNSQYFQPSFDSDHMLAIFMGERKFDIILPKSGRYGLNYNEIPFYFEDCNSRLVHVTDYSSSKQTENENAKSFRTHQTKPEDNQRRHELRVLIDTDSDSLHIKGEVRLSGQFSTLGRFAYLGQGGDPTVDRNYYTSLGANLHSASLNTSELRYSLAEYPYTTEAGISFTIGGRVDKLPDGFSVDMKGFFTHILKDPETTSRRFLDYYHDFSGSDEYEYEEYEYELQFLRPMELSNPVQVQIENSFGIFEFNVKQNDSLSVSMSSRFVVKNTSVAANDISEVTEIAEAMNSANDYLLELK